MLSWLGPYNSGETVEAGHIWTDNGTYEIILKAKDDYSLESEWSDPLSVSMPRNKPYINTPLLQFLEQLMERFPLFAQILQLPVFEKLLNP